MSAICGFIDRAGALQDPRAALRAMHNALVQRGSDGAAEYLHGGNGISVCWRGTDLAANIQLPSNEDRTIHAVCDGRILNAADLRDSLERKGHGFRTHSPFECVVHAYEEYGSAFPEHIDGPFALAVYDAHAERLIIARDRVGARPLFYTDTSPVVAFASEPKALLACPGVARELDPVALQQYLLFGCVFAPRAIFRGMLKLLEGHSLVIDKDATRPPRRFWRCVFPLQPERRSEREWLDNVDTILRHAVQRRLVAGEPTGAFLSGGIDSSLVVAHLCRLLPPEQVQTFSMALDDPAYDESHWSRWAARLLGTTHHEFRLEPQHLIGVIDTVLDSLDEPMSDSSIIPTHAIAALARQHVPAAFAGDAGDETFGGYPKYFAHRWAAVLQHVPAGIRHWCLEQPLRFLPASDGSVLLGQNKVAAFFRSIDQHYALRNQFWVSAFLPEQLEELTGTPLLDGTLEPILRRAEEYQGPDDIVTKAMFLDFKLLLLDGNNVKTDRAGALAGLEFHEPFMDTAMIELAARIPSRLKVKGMCTKYLAKRLTERYFPKKFVYRKKWGFGIPIKRWIRDALRPRFEVAFAPDTVRRAGLVNPDVCARLLREHVSGQASCAGQLWALYVLQHWRRTWGGSA